MAEVNDQELRNAVTDDEYNAFVHVDHEGFAEAKAASAERSAAGALKSPIDGLTVAVKDNMDVAGLPTGNGSSLFDDAPAAAADARAVGRLRDAGVAILGKTCSRYSATRSPQRRQEHSAPSSRPGSSSTSR